MKRLSYRPRRRRGRGFTDYLAAFGLMLVVALAAAWLDGMNEQSLTGTIHVVDGDSVRIDARDIRLAGIDAPEFDQTCQRKGQTWRCGRLARDHLQALVNEHAPVLCRGSIEDKYQRLLAVCEGRKVNLNALMVRDGLATAYGNYEVEQAAARSASRGLWAGEFQRPQEFRAQKGDVASEDEAVSFIAQLRLYAQTGLAKLTAAVRPFFGGGQG